MRLPVALVQLDASEDVDANIAAAISLAAEAAAGGARLVALPEYLQFRGSDDGFRASARPIPGPFTDAFAEVARQHDAWILVGSVAETSPDRARPHNTSVLIAPTGLIVATYRKIHLFDVAVDAGPVDTESARVTPGQATVVADVDDVKVGLSICYDLRFPGAVSDPGPGRRRGPDRAGQLHGADRPRPLGGAAPRSSHRERGVGPGAIADRWPAGPAGIRSLDDHRPVGHGRRPGAPTASASSGRTWRRTASPRSVVRSLCWPTGVRWPIAEVGLVHPAGGVGAEVAGLRAGARGVAAGDVSVSVWLNGLTK